MKLVKYIALVFFSLLWLAGCSGTVATWLYENNLIKDDYRYGDLYRTSNLPQFKEVREVCKPLNPEKRKNAHVVIAGDSFTENGRVEASDLATAKYTRVRVDGSTYVKTDSSDFNVLIIETVERHFRERFNSKWRGVSVEEPAEKPDPGLWEQFLALEMPYNSQRHETILFGYVLTMKFREWKALLNYSFFHRVDSDVRLNGTEEHLLYYLPSEPGISSAFEPIEDTEINTLVANVNEANRYYSELGYDKIILSIIPNKTSILGRDLGVYNDLVKRVQNHPDLEMEVLDSFTAFNKMGSQAYAKGDTHWSCSGQTIWLEKLNKIILNSSSTSEFQ